MLKRNVVTDEALKRAIVRSQIGELVVEYAYRLDRADFPGVVELFTEDCEVLSPRPPFFEPHWETIRGRKALADSYALPAWQNPNRTMRHVIANLRLIEKSETEVTGTVAVIGYRYEGKGVSAAMPMMVGDYDDVYRLDHDHRWRIYRRKVVIAFLAPSLLAGEYPETWGLPAGTQKKP